MNRLGFRPVPLALVAAVFFLTHATNSSDALPSSDNDIEQVPMIYIIVPLLVGLAFLVCGATCIFKTATATKRQEGTEDTHGDLDRQVENLCRKSIEKLKSDTTPVEECVLCVQPIDLEEPTVQMKCGHAFHAACAAQWKDVMDGNEASVYCPLCTRSPSGSPKNGVARAAPTPSTASADASPASASSSSGPLAGVHETYTGEDGEGVEAV